MGPATAPSTIQASTPMMSPSSWGDVPKRGDHGEAFPSPWVPNATRPANVGTTPTAAPHQPEPRVASKCRSRPWWLTVRRPSETDRHHENVADVTAEARPSSYGH
jgi:hypothetical protein